MSDEDEPIKVPLRKKTTDEIMTSLFVQIADLSFKLVNLANKLEEHMKEADAHNPAMMHKKK